MLRLIIPLFLALFCMTSNAQDIALEVTNDRSFKVCDSDGAKFKAYVYNVPAGITVSKVELLESSTIVVESSKWDRTDPWEATVYLKEGKYTPELRVTFSDQSNKTIGLTDTLEVVSVKNVYPDATVSSSSNGCINDTITFSSSPASNSRHLLWHFGDLTFAYDTSTVKHVYNNPGSYSVDFSIYDIACRNVHIDTSISFINVAGPKAYIHHPGIETGHAITKPTDIPLAVFMQAKAIGKPDIIEYDELRKVSSYTLKTYDVYHGTTYKTELDSINIESIYALRNTSRYDKLLIDKPTTSQKANVIVEYELVKNVGWKPTDPLPSSTVYRPGFLDKQFELQEYAMPDTQIYGNGQPNFEVQFTNFSTLFRPSSPRTTTYQYGSPLEELQWRLDSVKYPSFPYAGDTLQYFWDFNDPSAKACTSTVSKPDASCAFSTEKLPKHTYAKSGCFSPSLTATDPKTGCANTTSIQIVNEFPDGGWDEKAYGKSMSLLKQKELIGKGFLDGLGLQLTGLPCAANAFNRYSQDLDIDGTLPSCGREDYWLVFDVEDDCDTIWYKTNVNGSVTDTFTLACEWLNSHVVENLIRKKWSYTSPGWKSLGLVIKNGNAYDTTFYKNYRYILDANAAFTLTKHNQLDSVSQRAYYKSTSAYPDRPMDSIIQFYYQLRHEGTPIGKEPFVQIDSLLLENGGDVLQNLSDTFSTIALAPGKYRIMTTASGKRQADRCYGGSTQQFWVGHFADLRVKNACFGDTTYFFDSIFYWMDQIHCDLSGDIFNYTCTDREKFFQEPTANKRRQSFQNMAGYSLPKFTEKIAYDYENDGIIDFTYQLVNGKNVGAPKHVYSKPGKHTCALWSMDSLGLWQKDTFTVEMSSSSSITLEREKPEDSVLYCLPNIYKLKANAGVRTSKITQVSWYVNNKRYAVSTDLEPSPFFTLTSPGEYLIRAEIDDDLGCTYNLQAPRTRVEAPVAKYAYTLPADNCLPMEITVKNTSSGADEFSWSLNQNVVGQTKDLSNFEHTITKANKYQLHLDAYATYITAGADTVKCVDRYSKPDSFVVKDEIISAFSVDKSQGLKVQFNDLSTNAKGDIDWFFYDGASLLKQDVTTAGNPVIYTFPTAGDYRVCQAIKNENCSESVCQNIWVAPTGIIESSDGELKLYPNPNKGRFTLERSSGINRATLDVYNAAGKRVFSKKIGASESLIEVNTGSLSPGIYLLKMIDKDSTHKAKLVIE